MPAVPKSQISVRTCPRAHARTRASSHALAGTPCAPAYLRAPPAPYAEPRHPARTRTRLPTHLLPPSC
eukprot:6200660-Pleurochrysis_carterae.AAC.1